jgi:hypothetical protein
MVKGELHRSHIYWAKLWGFFTGGSPCFRMTGISSFNSRKRSLPAVLFFGASFLSQSFFNIVKPGLQFVEGTLQIQFEFL